MRPIRHAPHRARGISTGRLEPESLQPRVQRWRRNVVIRGRLQQATLERSGEKVADRRRGGDRLRRRKIHGARLRRRFFGRTVVLGARSVSRLGRRVFGATGTRLVNCCSGVGRRHHTQPRGGEHVARQQERDSEARQAAQRAATGKL